MNRDSVYKCYPAWFAPSPDLARTLLIQRVFESSEPFSAWGTCTKVYRGGKKAFVATEINVEVYFKKGSDLVEQGTIDRRVIHRPESHRLQMFALESSEKHEAPKKDVEIFLLR